MAKAPILLLLNLLFFTIVSSGNLPCPPKTKTPSGTHRGSSSTVKCPRDVLKLGACANLLNGVVNIVVGTRVPKVPCCSLISNLADSEAAVCLCTAIKGNILGVNLNVPVSLSVLLNYCGKKIPSGFQCI